MARGIPPWVTGAAAVVVTVGALVIAGTAPTPSHQVSDATSHTRAVPRTLVCAGGLAHAGARIGVSEGAASNAVTTSGPVVHKDQATLDKRPLIVTGSAVVAARTYAVRAAHDQHWFAAGSCPGPRSDAWFVGAGASQGHHATLSITNPLPGSALVDIRVLGPKGQVTAPGLRNINIASRATVKFQLSKVAPAVGDLAVQVRTTRGLVAASAADTWSRDFVDQPIGDWVEDQPAATRRLTLAGLPSMGATSKSGASKDGATALIANPGPTEAVVALTLAGAEGTYAPTKGTTIRVQPGSVKAVDLTATLKTAPAAVRLSSNVPIAATVRGTSGSDSGYASTIAPLGSSSVVGIPTHQGPARLVLVAKESKEHVTVTGYSATGARIGSRMLTVPARASLSTTLWSKAVALQISGAEAAGGVVVLDGKGKGQKKVGFAVLRLVPSASQARVPPVAPAWIMP